MYFLCDLATFARPPSNPQPRKQRIRNFLKGAKRNLGDAANVGWSTLGGASTMSIASMHGKTRKYTPHAMVTGAVIGAGTSLRQVRQRRKLEAATQIRKPKSY